jgi:hypothetical protein
LISSLKWLLGLLCTQSLSFVRDELDDDDEPAR